MATKKPRLTQAQKFAIPKLRELKRKGLFAGNVRRPSKYGMKQARVYDDVISGRASVISVPSHKKASSYKGAFRVKGNKVVVPKEKGETVRYDKKRGVITGVREAYGKRIRKDITPQKAGSVWDLPAERKGQLYTIPFRQGTGIVRFTFSTRSELAKFMSGYNDRWPNWINYVEIESVDDAEDEE